MGDDAREHALAYAAVLNTGSESAPPPSTLPKELMPPNAYLLLAIAGSVLRGGLALWLMIASGRAVHARRTDPNTSEPAETLVAVLALPVIALTLCGGALDYLVLRRWQTELPGAMCLYGVVTFGQGQRGLLGWLPVLFEAGAGLKATVLLAASCWLMCLRIEMRARLQTTRSPALILGVCLGVATLAAAATDTVFLSTPRTLSASSTGCCVIPTATSSREVPPALSAVDQKVSWALFLSSNLVLLSLLVAVGRVMQARNAYRGNRAAAVLAAMGVVSAVFSIPFARDVLSPQLLGLPYHRCVYDLVESMPEMLAAFGLYFVALVALGSSVVASRLYASTNEAAATPLVAKTLTIAAHALLGSLVMVCMIAALEWK